MYSETNNVVNSTSFNYLVMFDLGLQGLEKARLCASLVGQSVRATESEGGYKQKRRLVKPHASHHAESADPWRSKLRKKRVSIREGGVGRAFCSSRGAALPAWLRCSAPDALLSRMSSSVSGALGRVGPLPEQGGAGQRPSVACRSPAREGEGWRVHRSVRRRSLDS